MFPEVPYFIPDTICYPLAPAVAVIIIVVLIYFVVGIVSGLLAGWNDIKKGK